MSGDIRRLDLRDQDTLDALVALQRASYRVEADLLGAATLPALTESPRALRRSGEFFLGRYDGDRLAGAISWKRRRDLIDIHRLVVHPDFFRRGMARELLAALEAEEPGAERMLVATGAANLPARRLYESRDFRPVDEHVVRGNITIVTYERRLTA